MATQQKGPPYIPNTAGVGGTPTRSVDAPILSVLLVLYILAAAIHQSTYQLNRRHHHKFYMSWALFGFCMARVATCTLRLAWTTHLSNASLAIAAGIFTNVGILVAYVVVLLLALRVFRACQPRLGWNAWFDKVLRVMYVVLGVALCLVIAFTVLSFYTLNTTLRSVAMWIQRGAITYMMLFNILSLLLFTLSLLLPAPGPEPIGLPATGTLRTKQAILGVALFFTLFIAGFRTGTTWAPARPAADPAWWDSKAAFYTIEFGFEIVIIYWLAAVRFDRRFWVPDGSRGPGDYRRGVEGEGDGVGKEGGRAEEVGAQEGEGEQEAGEKA